jgi:uncharacterized phiE125 gp8 family phage protein
MALICVTQPVVEPVTLAEAKVHCRVDISEDDAYLAALITAARQYVEIIARPRLALLEQTWRYVADHWPDGDTLELRPYPLRSVTSVSYTDIDGVTATVPSTDYLVDTSSEPGRLRLKRSASWPGATLAELNGLRVEFVAGYGATPGSVPVPLKQVILLLVGHWYETREPVQQTGAIPKEVPMTVHALLQHWRREV